MKVELDDVYQLLEQVVTNQLALAEKLNVIEQAVVQKAKPKPVEGTAKLNAAGKVVE